MEFFINFNFGRKKKKDEVKRKGKRWWNDETREDKIKDISELFDSRKEERISLGWPVALASSSPQPFCFELQIVRSFKKFTKTF